jgi:hypothetical protein
MIDVGSWAYILIHKNTNSNSLVTPTVVAMNNVDPSNTQPSLPPMTTPLIIMTILGDLVYITLHYPTATTSKP